MFDLSNIFDKYKDEKNKNAPQPALPGRTPLREAQIDVNSAFGKELEKVSTRAAGDLYEAAVALALRVYRPQMEYNEQLFEEIKGLVEKIVDLLQTPDNGLLLFVLVDYPAVQDYLAYHVVNVTIMCVEMGLGLNYDRGVVAELGTAAFIHDIGLMKYQDIAVKPGLLTNEEFSTIKQHPQAGVELLKKFGKNLSRSYFEVVSQEHERVNGTGYPEGLKSSNISEYSQIVGLADTYEAMIHQRPYRKKYTPLETIKVILENKGVFGTRIIKVLIERIGIFPAGMFVRLNTKEVAAVVKTDPKLPLRPTVKILFDAMGAELREPKIMNLAENSVIYIEECLESKSA